MEEEEFESDYLDVDPSDLGFDPYAGTYVDDDPFEEMGYDYGDFTDAPDYD